METCIDEDQPKVMLQREWPTGEPAARIIQMTSRHLLFTVHDRYGTVHASGVVSGCASRERTWLRARGLTGRAARRTFARR